MEIREIVRKKDGTYRVRVADIENGCEIIAEGLNSLQEVTEWLLANVVEK